MDNIYFVWKAPGKLLRHGTGGPLEKSLATVCRGSKPGKRGAVSGGNEGSAFLGELTFIHLFIMSSSERAQLRAVRHLGAY